MDAASVLQSDSDEVLGHQTCARYAAVIRLTLATDSTCCVVWQATWNSVAKWLHVPPFSAVPLDPEKREEEPRQQQHVADAEAYEAVAEIVGEER